MADMAAAAPRILGDTVYLMAYTHGGTFTPAAPDATPTVLVYDNANLQSRSADIGVTPTVTQASGVTGAYVIEFDATAGNGFASNEVYYVIVSWAVSSTAYESCIELPVA